MNKFPALVSLAAMVCTAACQSWPGLAEPVMTLSPQLSLLRPTGDTRMGPTPGHTNASQRLRRLGVTDRDEGIGGKLTYGDEDGIAGFEFEYLKLEFHDDPGTTTSDWGAIPAFAATDARLHLEEYRLRYLVDVLDYKHEDTGTWFKAGVGLQLNHRELRLTVTDIGTSSAQRLEARDIASPQAAVRLAGGRGPVALTADLAINGGWELGSRDLEGSYYDFSVLASYTLEGQDLALYGGYRRFQIRAEGHSDTQLYDLDFTFDGWVLGVRFTF